MWTNYAGNLKMPMYRAWVMAYMVSVAYGRVYGLKVKGILYFYFKERLSQQSFSKNTNHKL